MVKLFQKQSGIVKVLFGTLFVVCLMLIWAVFHYGRMNKSEDPRVLDAKKMLLQYEKGIESDEYGTALSLLNSIDDIYKRTPGYEQSFERGVILNNKASIYLVMLETDLLNEEEITRESMMETLKTAEQFTSQAIALYETWLSKMGGLSRQEVDRLVRQTFSADDPLLKDAPLEQVIEKRIDDIMTAQQETKRRLSVTYTNMGVISRYKGELLKAKEQYEKAIALWDRNYTAKDNLNVLLNQPVDKRSIIDRLFPPERTKDLNQ